MPDPSTELQDLATSHGLTYIGSGSQNNKSVWCWDAPYVTLNQADEFMRQARLSGTITTDQEVEYFPDSEMGLSGSQICFWDGT